MVRFLFRLHRIALMLPQARNDAFVSKSETQNR